jgi:hypothetical protein
VESLAGGSGEDTLTAQDTTNAWSIAAGGRSGRSTAFSAFTGMENLVGGT